MTRSKFNFYFIKCVIHYFYDINIINSVNNNNNQNLKHYKANFRHNSDCVSLKNENIVCRTIDGTLALQTMNIISVLIIIKFYLLTQLSSFTFLEQ
jgi:hypothetical protein